MFASIVIFSILLVCVFTCFGDLGNDKFKVETTFKPLNCDKIDKSTKG